MKTVENYFKVLFLKLKNSSYSEKSKKGQYIRNTQTHIQDVRETEIDKHKQTHREYRMQREGEEKENEENSEEL